MSINWRWEDKMGTMQIDGFQGGERKVLEANVYDCNGLWIGLFEWTDEEGNKKYSMASFAADESHMKNMLGLSKEYPEDRMDYIHEMKLDMRYGNARKTAKLLMQAQSKGKWSGTLTTY